MEGKSCTREKEGLLIFLIKENKTSKIIKGESHGGNNYSDGQTYFEHTQNRYQYLDRV
jgi:hypothetical protein